MVAQLSTPNFIFRLLFYHATPNLSTVLLIFRLVPMRLTTSSAAARGGGSVWS